MGLEGIRGLRTTNEIGQDYGVHPVQVGQWKKEIVERAKTLFASKREPKEVNERTLYSEIGRLKMELDWLKKSSGRAIRGAARLGQSSRATVTEQAM